MSFYSDWLTDLDSNKNCNAFIEKFLIKDELSINPLLNADDSELNAFYEVLSRTPFEKFLEVLISLGLDRPLGQEDMLQYSTFYAGAQRIPELLLFYSEGADFIELGYQLKGAQNVVAQRKYGENHSKLAEAMSLVTISNSRPRISKITALGIFLTKNYAFEEKQEVLKKLLIRNYFLQILIKSAFKGNAKYFDIASNLKYSTAYRRRTNTIELVNYILKGTEWENYLDNINWKLQ